MRTRRSYLNRLNNLKENHKLAIKRLFKINNQFSSANKQVLS